MGLQQSVLTRPDWTPREKYKASEVSTYMATRVAIWYLMQEKLNSLNLGQVTESVF